MKRLTIAFHLFMLPQIDVGGTQYATHLFAKWLVAQGHRVIVLSRLEPGLSERESIEGYEVRRIPRWNIPIFGTLLYFLRVAFIVRNLGADIFHEQGICGVSFFVKLFSRAKSVIYGRGGDVYGVHPRKEWFLRASLKSADQAIALTNDMRERMQRVYNRQVTVIPNTTYMKIKESKKYPKKWKFVSVSRLIKAKGTHVTIEAIRLLKDKGFDVHLVCVGDGPELPNLKSQVRDSKLEGAATFMGKLSHDEIERVLASCDLFVFPTDYPEGFPNVILEAFASGLPVITSKVSGNTEIVREGVVGYTVQPNNPVALAEACEKVIRDKSLYENLSRNCIEEVKRYAPEKVYQEIMKVYSALI